MKTVNSLSGGKTSSYIAVNYPADYNVFSLVRTNDKLCQYPDKKVRQIVSDLIGTEFVGTTEQDNIIKIMLDLSERIDIDWITGKTFEDVISQYKKKDGTYTPMTINGHQLKDKYMAFYFKKDFLYNFL